MLRFAMTQLIKACAPLVRASGLNHQVQLNNWLLSTNPMPPISDADAIRGTLTKLHPDRAIIIRSLNKMADTATITALRKSGFRMLPAHVVYIAAALAGGAPSNNMKHDRRLLRKGRYQVVGDDGFEGTPLGLFRAKDGLSALTDHCPYRLVELSKGRVVDREIGCPYLGRRFGGAAFS